MAKAKKKAAKPKKKAPAGKPALKAKKAAKKTAKKTAKKPAPKKPAPKVKAKAPAKKVVAKKAASAKPVSAKASRPAPKGDLSNVLTPLDDRVLVRVSGAERRTAGGLLIPDTVADVSGNLQGRVVAVGRGHRDKKGRVRPMDVKLGDTVVFSEHSGSKLRVLDEDLILVREAEVMGIVS